MLRVGAGDFKQALVKHNDSQRAQRHPGGDLNFIHVVDFEVSGLFDPVFDEGIAQGVFGFGLRKIRPLNDETVFAHVTRQINSILRVSRQ